MSWICFDFKEKRVELTGYSLKSYSTNNPLGLSPCEPVQWVIEGSNDGSNWREVDRRNTQDLKGKSIVKTYSCSVDDKTESFRFVRLRQTGKNVKGNDYLGLSAMEFFGTLFRNPNDSWINKMSLTNASKMFLNLRSFQRRHLATDGVGVRPRTSPVFCLQIPYSCRRPQISRMQEWIGHLRDIFLLSGVICLPYRPNRITQRTAVSWG